MKKDIVIKAGGLYYPEAINWMWDHCTHLGKYTADYGTRYDLGVCEHPVSDAVSFAIVFGDEGGDYISNPIDFDYEYTHAPHKETIKRYLEHKRLKNDKN